MTLLEFMAMKNLSIVVLMLALVATLFVLSGCNTTKGVGTDIEKGGEALKNSADRNGAQ